VTRGRAMTREWVAAPMAIRRVGREAVVMTSTPPGDQPPIHGSDRKSVRRSRPGQTTIVAILLVIAIVVVLVLLL